MAIGAPLRLHAAAGARGSGQRHCPFVVFRGRGRSTGSRPTPRRRPQLAAGSAASCAAPRTRPAPRPPHPRRRAGSARPRPRGGPRLAARDLQVAGMGTDSFGTKHLAERDQARDATRRRPRVNGTLRRVSPGPDSAERGPAPLAHGDGQEPAVGQRASQPSRADGRASRQASRPTKADMRSQYPRDGEPSAGRLRNALTLTALAGDRDAAGAGAARRDAHARLRRVRSRRSTRWPTARLMSTPERASRSTRARTTNVSTVPGCTWARIQQALPFSKRAPGAATYVMSAGSWSQTFTLTAVDVPGTRKRIVNATSLPAATVARLAPFVTAMIVGGASARRPASRTAAARRSSAR